jgi:UDP-hydrolysing UDP-N-acetyl-D-glucosamine 2-epimerase
MGPHLVKTIALVTVARSDFGIYRSVISAIQKDPDLTLEVIASGMHMSSQFGGTISEVEAEVGRPVRKVEMLVDSDSPEAVSKSIGLGVIGFAQVFSTFKPDVLLVLGDRYEMFAAVVAAMSFMIPVAHIHGGESTEGLIDEYIRHAITKMSHLHFVSTEAYRTRVIQMGEQPSMVFNVGAPGLDMVNEYSLMSLQELASQLSIPLNRAPLLVTFHPVTLDFEQTETQIQQLLEALSEFDYPTIFTYPNADTSGRKIIEAIETYCQSSPNAHAVQNLGTRRYYSLMARACSMVGNSSSGIIEAASFELPVVNIGTRQRGRIFGENVVDVACTTPEIVKGIRTVLGDAFRAKISGMANPYGVGVAAAAIMKVLKSTEMGPSTLMKRFHDQGSLSL